MDYPKVFVVILNWNGLKDTVECLESVFKLDYPKFKVLVVDNGSRDDSVQLIRGKYKDVTLIENTENLGFAGGNNVGIRYALDNSAEYVWLLNNDTAVATDSLSKLVVTAESSPGIALVSPVIYYFDDPKQIQFAGSNVKWKDLSFIYPDLSSETIRPDFQVGKNVTLWGTALLVKRSCIVKIGLLKEEYFAYWEDLEYSLRSLNSGLRNVVCTSAQITHKIPLPGSVKFTRSKHHIYFIVRNRYFLGKEYLKGIASFNYKRNLFADLVKYVAFYREAGNKDYLEACLDGAWHGFLGPRGDLP